MNNMTVIALPASVNSSAELALNSALMAGLTDVLVLGYDSAGVLIVRSSKMTRAEGLFMAKKAEQWAMEGGLE
jgi:hypothetical protein